MYLICLLYSPQASEDFYGMKRWLRQSQKIAP